MITSIVRIALIGTFQFNSAFSAAINYEPIKITINENFNAQPGEVSQDLQKPGVLHQGANFYFKPQLTLPPGYIPPQIEGLISLIQQHHHSCSKDDDSKVFVEKDKLIEILKPFMYPMSEISKERLSEIVLGKENNLEIRKPITEELKPVIPEHLIIPGAPELPPLSCNGTPPIVEEEIKKEESVILEEPTRVFPTIPEIYVRAIEEPIINYVEPKPITSKFLVIPERPQLPHLSFNGTPPTVEEEVKREESVILEEPTGVFPTIPEIAVRPITESIISYVEPKSNNAQLVAIPEAPVLPSLSRHDSSSIIEEEAKKEKSVIFEKQVGMFPTIPEIDVRPIEEPINNYNLPKPSTSEVLVIAEAPVLPPLSFNGIPSIVKEEVKKEESIILEEPTGLFPTIPEIAVRPITEPIINYVEPKPINRELVAIPEAPVLPQLSVNDNHVIVEEVKIEEPIVVDVERKPAIQELVAITESPLLPSLSLHDISTMTEEEVKKEEFIIFEEPTGLFPTIPEIAVKPITEPIINYVEPKPINAEHAAIPESPMLPQLSANDNHVIVEEVKIEEPIVVDVEPKPAIQELVAITESPLLPSLSLHDISTMTEEEVKKEEFIIFEEPTGLFPTIPEIAVKPITEPIINYVEPKPINAELVAIPESPMLPQLSANDNHVIVEEVKIEEPIVVDVEPKPAIQELVAITEFPLLPSLSLHDISTMTEEEVKKEEFIIFEEPTGLFPTIPEIAVKPITEPIINYVEPKPINAEHAAIPESPMLPQLSANDNHVIVEEVKIEEPIVVDVEPKPAIQELVAITESPLLPSLSLHDISTMTEEEVKKEEFIIFEEPTGLFPTIPEIAVKPITEPIINYVEPKPINAELVAIPESPMLPQLSANDNHVIVEEVKIEEPIVVDVEPKPAIQELVAITESPLLPSLSLHDISTMTEEELKKEEFIIFEEPTGLFSTIPEIAVKPITEPIINYVEPKPINAELVAIPESPMLPQLSANDNHVIVEEVKIEEPIVVDVEPKAAIQELVAITEFPLLPSLSLHDISSTIGEEVKKEEFIIFEEPTRVFPTNPEIEVRPIEEPIINYVEQKPITSKLLVIPDAPVLPSLSFNGIPPIVEEEVEKKESIILEAPTGVLPRIPDIAVRPITEPIVSYVDPKSINAELVVIPEPPVLPSLSLHDISSMIEAEVKKEEFLIFEEPMRAFPTNPEIEVRPIEEPIINYVEQKPITSTLLLIPDAPVLPPLSFNGIPPIVEEVEKKESIILEAPTGVFPTIPEIAVRPIAEPIINYVERKPSSAEVVVIPEAPVLPPLSANDIHVIEEEVRIEEPIVVSETAESFALENNIFPITTEGMKIEVPILFKESIEVFPPTAEIYSGPTLQESKITDSYVLEEVSQPNPESVVTIKKALPIIPTPSNNIGVFRYVPFVSNLFNRAPKIKKRIILKPASVERFLLKKRPFELPVTPFPKLDLNAINPSIRGNTKQFLYPTSYAHDVVEKRIATNMAFKKQNDSKLVKNYIRSSVPKGPSYL